MNQTRGLWLELPTYSNHCLLCSLAEVEIECAMPRWGGEDCLLCSLAGVEIECAMPRWGGEDCLLCLLAEVEIECAMPREHTIDGGESWRLGCCIPDPLLGLWDDIRMLVRLDISFRSARKNTCEHSQILMQ